MTDIKLPGGLILTEAAQTEILKEAKSVGLWHAVDNYIQTLKGKWFGSWDEIRMQIYNTLNN